MTVAQKLTGFILGLAVVFAAAFGAGMALGPTGDKPADHSQVHNAASTVGQNAGDAQPPAGLLSTQNGYTLQLAQPRVDADTNVPLRFRITDSADAAVTRYVDSHGKQLHLIVVRRDMVGYQHVHPVLEENGTWSAPVDISRAGDYRVFADFTPAGGSALTLGADLHVAGHYDPRPLPAAGTTSTVDGYTVSLSGTPKAGRPSELTLSVSRDGKPITDLQPYLGAYGHLVALRSSDLAYLHVHPMGEPGHGSTPGGPDIDFHTTFPSNGDYRLFLDFQHQDVARTAEFTVSVGSADPDPTSPRARTADPAHTGHQY